MNSLVMPEPSIGRESYMHRAAKEVIARWLRELSAKVDGERWSQIAPIAWRPNRGAPHYGVWIEYPFSVCSLGHEQVWDECDDARWEERPPTVEELRAEGMRVACVADLAIQHKGRIVTAVEVVHRHPVPAHKQAFYAARGIDLVTVRASWVLGQTTRPARFKVAA